MAQIWVTPMPRACFITASSPESVTLVPVVGLSSGIWQRSMESPIPLALVTPAFICVSAASQKTTDSGPEAVVLV